MQRLKFGLVVLMVAALGYGGSKHQVGGSSLPALGMLLCPFTGFWQQAEPVSSDHTAPHIVVAGLAVSGEVVFDDRMTPHIFAPSLRDAAFLQGYLTATDRLWQMDIAVRSIGGRLAEVVGPVAVERDRVQRRKGLAEAATRTVAAWQDRPHEYELVLAYTAGVNAYLASLRPRDYPVEFKLMGYAPEAWTPFKSALFAKSMSESLSFRSHDLPATLSRQILGDSLFATLFPERNPHDSPVIPAGSPWPFQPIALADTATSWQLGVVPTSNGSPVAMPPAHNGSNNWAVAGSRTASGFPILCNDPHLSLTLPSIWYELQIHTPACNAYGVSLPGVPGIALGFNEHIAWGSTNGSQDVLDWLYVSWTNDQRTQYLLDGQPQTPTWITDTIWVRGQAEPILERTPWTVWGPVVYTDSSSSYQDLALRWVAHQPYTTEGHTELGAFFGLMQARNYDDYRAALHGYVNPIQNFVFAAHDGDIALAVTGKLPLKRPGQGRFVDNGAVSAANWLGYIPAEQMPVVHNPDRGFVSSANQQSTDDSYPYYYNGNFDDYRGRYINQQLAAKSAGVTIADMQALQLDNYSLRAAEGLPVLLALWDQSPPANLSAVAREMLADLRAWDYRFEADARAPTVFDEWLRKTYTLTFDELSTHPDSSSLLWPEYWRWIELMDQQPNHPIFDLRATPGPETAATLVHQAWEAVVASLGPNYPQPSATWGDYKGTAVPHLVRIGAFGSELLLNGGFRDAPNAVTHNHGPSWRMVVELTNPVQAYGVYPGGQSGNPGSPYYRTGLRPWSEGKYYPLYLLQNATDTAEMPVRKRLVFK